MKDKLSILTVRVLLLFREMRVLHNDECGSLAYKSPELHYQYVTDAKWQRSQDPTSFD